MQLISLGPRLFNFQWWTEINFSGVGGGIRTIRKFAELPTYYISDKNVAQGS